MTLNDEFIPIVLPHYRRQEDRVFFLVSRRETLVLKSACEVMWFDAINGTMTLAELERGYPNITGAIGKWVAHGIIKLIPPKSAPSSGTHAVVVEPHMDDAILSLGGRLINRSAHQRTTILSITKWSSYTSYLLSGRTDFSDLSTVTRLRMAESRIATRLCGAEFLAMSENDTIVEMGTALPPEALPRLHRNLQAWGEYGPTDQEVLALSQRISPVLRSLNPDELWIPMGLGVHPDHMRTRQACLKLLLTERLAFVHTRIFLYRDIPYARQFPLHADLVLRALGAAGAKLVRRAEDITDAFESKVDILSVYASQWKQSKIRTTILDDAQSSDRIPGRQETYYEMIEPPRYLPRPSDMSFDQPFRSAFASRLRDWIRGASSTERLNIFVRFTPLRWDLVLQMLRDQFPRAELSLFVPSGCVLPVDRRSAINTAVHEVATIDQMDEINRNCEADGQWTIVFGKDARRRSNVLSDRCLIAPSAGLVYMLVQEDRASSHSIP